MPTDDPVSTLDRISLWMDAPERRLDAVMGVKLKSAMSAEALVEGAARARRCYPRASAIAVDGHWVESSAPDITFSAPGERASIFAGCLRAGLDPTKSPAVRQWVSTDPTDGATEILIQSHHAAVDLMSILLFLGVQLGRKEGPDSPRSPIALREHPRPVRKSRFAQWGPSTRLWARRKAKGGERAHVRFDVDARPIREALEGRALGFTYNDVLGVAALEMVRRFQKEHGASTKHLSLWFPVSLRVDPWSGFGNGSSRIRIYARHLGGPSWIERARGFRAQVAWCKDHGEWAVPARHPLLALPAPLQRPLLRAYLDRPWVDMGTILFSHLERLPDQLASVDTVEIVSTLDRRHPAGIVGVTVGERTQLTLTWDPARLDADDAARLVALYRAAMEEAQHELSAETR